MSEGLSKKVDLNIIRYANCWEDADVLLAGLSATGSGRMLSIGSGGDNSFSLLTTNPELVVAVDINKVQLYLIELKKACINKLEHNEALEFLGFTPSEHRTRLFNSIKNELSTEAGNYWEANINLINNGVIYAGKFEKYFLLFSNKILPLIHSKKRVSELFATKSQAEQEIFYSQEWNTWRWRLLFNVFFSKYVMGKYGRDPEFLKEVKISVPDYIFNKAGMQLRSEQAQNNFILHFNLTGRFGELLPHYMRKENYDNIRSNLDRLVIKHGYAEDAISHFGKFYYMNLSNIFEYMDSQHFETAASALINGSEKDAKLVYWNLMVERRISGILPDKVHFQEELSIELSKKDKGFFYNRVIIDKIK